MRHVLPARSGTQHEAGGAEQVRDRRAGRRQVVLGVALREEAAEVLQIDVVRRIVGLDARAGLDDGRATWLPPS